MIKWENIPCDMQTEAVWEYYEILSHKKISLVMKRIFDVIAALIMLVILSSVIGIIAVAIKLDSPGKIIFKQERITRYNKRFYIYKFRTMVENAEQFGSQVTVDNDIRITKIGKFLRKYRLDELLQLVNVIRGEMSFVGTRPEVKKYVSQYTDEMYATLLMPAGVTSLASIKYKDEDRLLSETDDVDYTYVKDILPEKMKFNLEYIKKFDFLYDIKLMFMTFFAVLSKETECDNNLSDKREKEGVF